MNYLLKKIENPTLPMFISNWIFGIGIIEYPFGTPHRVISLLYTTTLMIIYCSLFTYLHSFVLSLTDEFEISRQVLKVEIYGDLVLTICITLLGWYRSKGMHFAISQIVAADKYIEKLGVPRNYNKEFRKQVGTVAGSLSIVIFLVTINSFLIFTKGYPPGSQVLAVIVTNYPFIIMFVVDAIFLNILGYAHSDISKVNNVLKSLITSTVDCPQHTGIIKRYLSENSISESHGNCNGTLDKTSTIATAKNAHLNLIKACRQTDDSFGLHILMMLLVAIIVITGNLYHLYVLIKETSISNFNFCTLLVDACIWICYYLFKIYIISSRCKTVVEEATITGDIISEVYDEPYLSEETRNEIKDFHIYLIQNSLVFEAHGFIKLDFTLIQGILSSVTTYLMILIQLGTATTLSTDESN